MSIVGLGACLRDRVGEKGGVRETKTEGMNGVKNTGLGKGLLQTYWSTSEVLEQEHHDRQDQELECLRRLVKDLESAV